MKPTTSDLTGPHASTPTASIRWDSSWPESAKNESREELTTYLLERFGIQPSVLDEYHLFENKKGWSILRKSETVPYGAHLKVGKVGLRAFRKVGRFIKPTTRFIQSFGRLATKAVCRLNTAQLESLVFDGKIPVDLNLDKGYVILALEDDMVLGLGFYGHGTLHSQLPKSQIRAEML